MAYDPAKNIATDPMVAAKKAAEWHERALYWDKIANDPSQSKVRRQEAAYKREHAKNLALETDRWIPAARTGRENEEPGMRKDAK